MLGWHQPSQAIFWYDPDYAFFDILLIVIPKESLEGLTFIWYDNYKDIKACFCMTQPRCIYLFQRDNSPVIPCTIMSMYVVLSILSVVQKNCIMLLGNSNFFLCFALPWLIGFSPIFQKEKKRIYSLIYLFFSAHLLCFHVHAYKLGKIKKNLFLAASW